MKTKKTILISGLILIVSTIAGYILLGGKSNASIEVLTVAAQKADVTKLVTATGTIEPITQVEVGTQVSGVVEKIYVDYNSIVEEGQLIAELDKTNLRAALAQAQASYDNALNEKNYLEVVYHRQKELYDNSVLSKADFDEAYYNYQMAKGTVAQRRSELQTAKTNLGYADIYAPIDGVVLSKDIDEGQTVAASFSTPTLFTIAQDLREMQVEADVDEADIGNVQEGQRVSFTVDAYLGEVFEGTVTQVRLDPTVTSNVVTYTVVIRADNPDLKLKPGLTATISIYTLELKDVLTTEAKTLAFTPDPELLMQYMEQQELTPAKPENAPSESSNEEPTVWVLDEQGSITPKRISKGESDGVHVQVLGGIKEGDQLVYSMKGVEASDSGAGAGANESPFMPKPPGSKNKK